MSEPLTGLLTRRMKDEIALLRDFVAILRLEQQALSDGDAEAIASATNAKSMLARQLGQLSTERNLALAREGYAADRAGIDALIAAHPEAAALVPLRERLIMVAAEADELNRANGEIIRLRMSHTQKAIGALLGSGGMASTYGRDGRSQLGGGPVARHFSTRI